MAAAANSYFGWLPIEFGGTNTGELTDIESEASLDVDGAAVESRSADGHGGFVQLDPDEVGSTRLRSSSFDNANPDFTEPARAQVSESSFRDQLRNDRPVNQLAGKESAVNPQIARDGQSLRSPSLFQPPADAATLNSNRRLRSTRTATGIVQTANEVEYATAAAGDQARTNSGVTSEIGRQNAQSGSSANPTSATVDLRSIDRLIEASENVAALRELSKVYWSTPGLRPMIQKRIETMANAVYFSPQPHYIEPYVVQSGDQLRKIAKRYHVSWKYLATLNRIEPRKIRAGQKLKVVKGPFSAVVDLSDFELIVHAHGYYVRKYRVGIGKDGTSPLGKFKVLEKLVDPQYTDPDGRVIDGGAKHNPLGNCWVGIGDGFGIHGTIEPDSIGRAESRGCIRMINAKASELFDLLEVGSEIVIRR